MIPHIEFLRRSARLLFIAALPVAFSAQAQTQVHPSFHAIDAEPLDAVPAGALVLHNGWSMREETVAGNHGELFSTTEFHPVNWYQTSVPTTVLGALVRAGVYPDPYIGTNNDKIPDASNPASPWNSPWWFRTTFRLIAPQAGKVILLHLDGINYRAAVWVNGKEVANERDTVGMFRRFRFDISRAVHPGKENALAIRIFPVDYPGVPAYRDAGSDSKFQQNVTEMGALGWDWVPPARDRNMGIWQHVWIESSGPMLVSDPAAFTDVELPGGKSAAVTVRATIENAGTTEEPADVVAEIKPEDFAGPTIRILKNVIVPPGMTREVVLTPSQFKELEMKTPRLWWPHGYGEQPLYRLTVEARTGGKLSSRRVTRFGVRKIGYYFNPSEYAHTLTPVPDGQPPFEYPRLKTARVFTVNGRPIRLAGGALVPDFLLSWSARQYRDQVRLMTEGNQTVGRVWGGGIMMPDVFYEEADRRGLLIWQDLARSSFDVAWKKKEAEIPAVDPDLFLANMRDTILRLRGRTSLLLWCGTNEAAMQTDIGKALQNDLLPALDGTRPWIPSSSTEPPWANEPLGVRSFGPYRIQSIKEYFDHYANDPDFRFKDEIGLESVPRLNSIEKAVPTAGAQDDDATWKTQALLDHGLPVESLTPFMRSAIGGPISLADFTSMAELLSAQSYRAIFEAANKNRPRNHGTMVWMTNAAWLDCMYQLYDWYLHPTAAYYAVKSASKPLHVQYAADDHTLQVVSTRPESLRLRVKATVTSAEGSEEEVKQYDLEAAADATTEIGPAPPTVADGKLHFLALDLTDENGHELDRLVNWIQNDEHWPELLNIPPVRVSAHVVSTWHDRAGETSYQIEVVNRGTVPAVDMWTELTDEPLGQEVLPSFWSDNALTLLPGEKRLLTVSIRDTGKDAATRHLMAEGFNVLPEDFAISPGQKSSSIQLKITGLTWVTKEGKSSLLVKCREEGGFGPRWTTWPVSLKVDDRDIRTFRVALHRDEAAEVEIPMDLSQGTHRIDVGDKSIEVDSSHEKTAPASR